MMKSTIISLALVAATVSGSGVFEFLDSPANRNEFGLYLSRYGKLYDDTEEYELRYKTYLNNLRRIHEHNKQAEEGLHSFVLGVNHLADVTDDEYKAMLGYTPRAPTESRASAIFTYSGKTLPSSWDWRDHGVVAEVKNQGNCGSCWAFSAVAAMEGLYANKTGKVQEFSEQELVDCVLNGEDSCDHGGEMHDGFLEIVQHHHGKIESEEDYPYTAKSLKACKADDGKGFGSFAGYGNVTSGDENALAEAITERPIISVAIDASSFMFQLYHSGVFNWPYCKNTEDGLDHGVAVVGYGTDNGQDYWIVKNSWGSTWGQGGYIWMSRNSKNQCGIATDASFPLWEGEL